MAKTLRVPWRWQTA